MFTPPLNKKIRTEWINVYENNYYNLENSKLIVCKTDDGKTAFGSIPSEIEDGKLAGSIVFFDLGITDSITDKHRTYTPNFTIPVK